MTDSERRQINSSKVETKLTNLLRILDHCKSTIAWYRRTESEKDKNLLLDSIAELAAAIGDNEKYLRPFVGNI